MRQVLVGCVCMLKVCVPVCVCVWGCMCMCYLKYLEIRYAQDLTCCSSFLPADVCSYCPLHARDSHV